MKIQHVTIVDGLCRVSDSDAREFGDTSPNAGASYVRVDLRLKELAQPPPYAFMIETIGGIDLMMKQEDAKGLYIGRELRITIDDEV